MRGVPRRSNPVLPRPGLDCFVAILLAMTGRIVFICLLTFTPFTQASDLPDLGDPSSLALTKEKEQKLGIEFMREIRRKVSIIQDPILTDYINRLGDRLVIAAKADPDSFHFFIINNDQINAFAGPDGNVGVFTGLILETKSEGELAAVMAHEIAHVTQFHIARSYQEVKQNAIPMAAALLASVALTAVNPEAGAGAISATLAGTQQHIINFTRSNEEEADRVGIDTLYQANIDPQSMPDAFLTLERNKRLYGNQGSELLSTHPVTPSRIADAMNRVERYTAKDWRIDESYPLVKERLRVYTSNDNLKIINYYKQMLAASSTPENKLALEYGYALALLKINKLKKAKKVSESLVKQDPQSNFITDFISHGRRRE